MSNVKLHEFKVTMTCEGCSGAVQRVLTKLKDKGVEDFDISLQDQSVKVKSSLPAQDILEVIKRPARKFSSYRQTEYTKTALSYTFLYF